MHAPLPLDESPTVTAAESALARMLGRAKLADEAALLDALVARQAQLSLSNEALESLAGLCSGHAQKVFGPSRSRSPTLATVDKVMSVLGLSLVLLVDPSKPRGQASPRNASKVRQRLSPTTVARAKPIVLDELLRRAARRPYSNMTPKEFIRSQAREMIT
jgi:hypothetical protein